MEWNGIKQQQQHTLSLLHSTTVDIGRGGWGKRKRPKGIAANREKREVYEQKKVEKKGTRDREKEKNFLTNTKYTPN